MDLRTGKTYQTLKDALNDGVPTSDLAHVSERPNRAPKVTFPKAKPFARLKNAPKPETVSE